ncbi:MAG: hypothetical protein HC830_03820 [Bacteroidetes bacterium]|nr:hypothetical protein [Bacteroidota bacterium]
MKNTLCFLAILFTFGFLGTSCVSGKKFKATQLRIVDLQRDSLLAQNQIKAWSILVGNLKNERSDLLGDKKSLLSDNKTLQVENKLVQNDFDELSTASEMTITDQEEQLKNLNKIIRIQKELMNKLKNSIPTR